MGQTIRFSVQWGLPILFGMFLLALFVFARPASAQINPLPTPDPQPGSYGIEATKTQEPPTQPASVSTPANGATFATSPITVNGLCEDGLLVQISNNGVMVGAVVCENGSFSLEVSLFAGINELSATVYDDLDQAGPVSNLATVTYTDTSFTAFGELITLTSVFGRRAAPTGNPLQWPLQLSGGTGPYAFSIDWGDGSDTQLRSQTLAGIVDIQHTYTNAGIYPVNVQVTDTNGVSAFLQVVALSSGQVEAAATEEAAPTQTTTVLWIPAAVAVALLIPTYWLGRQSQVVSLRNKLLKERQRYKDA